MPPQASLAAARVRGPHAPLPSSLLWNGQEKWRPLLLTVCLDTLATAPQVLQTEKETDARFQLWKSMTDFMDKSQEWTETPILDEVRAWSIAVCWSHVVVLDA